MILKYKTNRDKYEDSAYGKINLSIDLNDIKNDILIDKNTMGGVVTHTRFLHDKKITKDYGASGTKQVHEYTEFLACSTTSTHESISLGNSEKDLDRQTYMKDTNRNDGIVTELYIGMANNISVNTDTAKYIRSQDMPASFQRKSDKLSVTCCDSNKTGKMLYWNNPNSSRKGYACYDDKAGIVRINEYPKKYINITPDPHIGYVESIRDVPCDGRTYIWTLQDINTDNILNIGMSEMGINVMGIFPGSPTHIGIEETIGPYIDSFNNDIPYELQAHKIDIKDKNHQFFILDRFSLYHPNDNNMLFVVLIEKSYFILKFEDGKYDILYAKLNKKVEGTTCFEMIREFGSSSNIEPYLYKSIWNYKEGTTDFVSENKIEYHHHHDYVNDDIDGYLIYNNDSYIIQDCTMIGIENIHKFAEENFNYVNFLDDLDKHLQLSSVREHPEFIPLHNNPKSLYYGYKFIYKTVFGSLRPEDYIRDMLWEKKNAEVNMVLDPMNIFNYTDSFLKDAMPVIKEIYGGNQ